VAQDAGLITAVVPLKISGRHYAHNIGRCDVLFASLAHFGAFDTIGEVILVVPDEELSIISSIVKRWGAIPIRLVPERSELPVFAAFSHPHQVRPWHRQQIIKLHMASVVDTPFVLMLDPDVIALRPITAAALLPRGLALTEPEPQSVHRQWWHDSAALLDVDPDVRGPGMSVTPAILSAAVCATLQRRLEEIHRRPWPETLLTAGTEWTEYTLYHLTSCHLVGFNRYHTWPEPGSPHLHSSSMIWCQDDLERIGLDSLMSSEDSGLFSVIQHVQLTPADIATAIPWLDLDIAPYPTPFSRRQQVVELYGAVTRRVLNRARRLLRRRRHRARP
jgi:hypothetical protein